MSDAPLCPMCGKGSMQKISTVEERIAGHIPFILDVKRCTYCGQKLAYSQDSDCVMCRAPIPVAVPKEYSKSQVCSKKCFDDLQRFKKGDVA